MKHTNRNAVPYTTKSGLQIGIAYTPPAQQLTQDAEIIQSALLGVQSPKFLTNGSIWYYAFLVILFIVIAAVVSK